GRRDISRPESLYYNETDESQAHKEAALHGVCRGNKKRRTTSTYPVENSIHTAGMDFAADGATNKLANYMDRKDKRAKGGNSLRHEVCHQSTSAIRQVKALLGIKVVSTKKMGANEEAAI